MQSLVVMMGRTAQSIFLLSILLASTEGCAPVEELSESSGGAIIDGSDSNEAQDSVVLLRIGEASCTGTLVAPNLVLTARHCVSTIGEGEVITRDAEATTIEVFRGRTTSEHTTANARGQQLFTDGEVGTVLEGNDLAFVLLDQNVGARTAPLRLRAGARDGETLTAVGWGLTEDGETPSRRQQREVVVAGSQGAVFAIGEGICFGDSGGPAFSSEGAVVGVASSLVDDAGDSRERAARCQGEDAYGTFTALSGRRALVDRAFEAAGAEPRIEGTDPVGKAPGDSCSSDHECAAESCSSGRCGGGSDESSTNSDTNEGTSSGGTDSDAGSGDKGSGSSDDGSSGGKPGGSGDSGGKDPGGSGK